MATRPASPAPHAPRATRGAEPRYVSLLEREGQATQVALPYFRGRKVAVMTLRSEADLQALKVQGER